MILDRITIDIDHYVPSHRLKALETYHALKRMDIVDDVVVHISTGGSGLHIEGHLNEVLSDDERLALRRSLHDDDQRTHLDEERGSVGHATDIYWSQKDGNDGERERMPGIWAALDRLEATRATVHARVKALAQHGRKGCWDTHGLNRPSLVEEGH